MKSDLIERLVSLILLIVFACLTVYGALFLRNPEMHQVFMIRVFTALAAAAVAAIMSGALTLLKVNSLGVKALAAISAIAVFPFVYFNDPLSFRGYRAQLAELRGDYCFLAVAEGRDLAHGARVYGGPVRISENPDELVARVTLMFDDKGNVVDDGRSSEGWRSHDVALSSSGRLMYTYEAIDTAERTAGFSYLAISKDQDGSVSELNGFFQRTGPDSGVVGTLRMRRKDADCRKFVEEAYREQASPQ
jgi:hypothetical protein